MGFDGKVAVITGAGGGPFPRGIESSAACCARVEVVYEQVCPLEQSLPQNSVRWIHGNASFVDVEREKKTAVPGVGGAAGKRATRTKRMTAGWFDLDYIGTVISYQLRCIR